MNYNQVWDNVGYMPNVTAQELRGCTFWVPVIGDGAMLGTVLRDRIGSKVARWDYAAGAPHVRPTVTTTGVSQPGDKFGMSLYVEEELVTARHPTFDDIHVGSLFGDTWTVMFWARSNHSSGDRPCWGFSTGGTNLNTNFIIGVYDGGFNVGDNVGGAQTSAALALGVTTYDWTHLAWVDDGTNYIAYRQGAAVASAGIATNPALSVARDFYLTRSGFAGTAYWDTMAKGYLVDFRIYNRGLSPTEIRGIGSGSSASKAGPREPFSQLFTNGMEYIYKAGAAPGLLLEQGYSLLLETGDRLLLEDIVAGGGTIPVIYHHLRQQGIG